MNKEVARRVTEEEPLQEKPAKEEPVQEGAAKEEPVQEEASQEEAVQEEAVQGEPAQEEELSEEGAETSVLQEGLKGQDEGSFPWLAAGLLLLAAAAVAVCAAVLMRRKKRTEPEGCYGQPAGPGGQGEHTALQDGGRRVAQVGKVHHIGKRKSQQDSFGVTPAGDGVFAVVADGMGGLADGDKVSQKIVMTMLQDAAKVRPGQQENILFEAVAHVNREVNAMLGSAGQYKSGSTLVAVLAGKDGLHWISVGDSRIYLYRNRHLIQLNQEHNYETELLIQAVNGEISFEEARMHPKRQGLTSFIGMGELKYVDGSRRRIALERGDKLLLMSDGVYNTLPEEEMGRILEEAGDVQAAAAAFESRILECQKPKQDNFTAVILEA